MPENTHSYAGDTPLQFAKRETQALLRKRATWVGLLAVGVILGLAGPFGTLELMRGFPRVGYWVTVAVLTFVTGSFVGELTDRVLRGTVLPKWPRIFLSGLAIGLAVTVVVLILNLLAFGAGFERRYVIELAANAIAISMVLAAALSYFEAQRSGVSLAASPRLLSRLPLEKRGPLISLSVSDHYTEVSTRAGQELLLMRFSDAIAETEPVAGLQVHRSHWVAVGEVVSAKRDGARAILTMSDGRDIPVSRTYVPQVKAAGVLPE